MKKILKLFIFLIFTFVMIGCETNINSKEKYKLSIDGLSEVILNDIKESYNYEEVVEIQIGLDNNVKVYINNLELQKQIRNNYFLYSFTMPNHDVTLLIKEDLFKPIIFEPTRSSIGCDEFEMLFQNSNLYLEDMGEISAINFTPEVIFEKYDIGFYQVTQSRNMVSFFMCYKENIITIETSSYINGNNRNFIHFALNDLNDDGYIEIFCSFNCNSSRPNWTFCFTDVNVYDTKTKNNFRLNTIYNEFAYFKENKLGVFGIYTATEENVDLANKLYSDFYRNEYNYTFSKKEIFLTTDNYEVLVTIDEDSINYPFLCEGMTLEFKVNTKMKWLGDTFTYTVGHGYLEGASASFESKDNYISCEEFAATAVVSTFIIISGMEIERSYNYPITLSHNNKPGVYDLIIDYRGETIIVEDFLTISEIK